MTDPVQQPRPGERVAVVDWRRYLQTFHDERAGTLERVLSRTIAGDHTPYRWLARAVSATGGRVLDLACGSGAMTRELDQPGRTVTGLDLSAGELGVAASRHPGPWLRADALRLPIADGTIDAVTSCMGLVVVTPLDTLIAEVARVLKPGGLLAAIAPAVRPLGARDLRTLTPLTTRLRTRPQFPGPVELTSFVETLNRHGLRKVEDARERYHFTISSRTDAELLLSALYLPTTRKSRIEMVTEYLERRINRHGPVEVAVPMRRLVAIK